VAPEFEAMSEAEIAALFSPIERLAMLPEEERRQILNRMGPAKVEQLWTSWGGWARPGQLPPDGDWRVWLMMAGRGYGKTRAGAEWVHELAAEGSVRIALVGASENEVREVMVEGSSGLLACSGERERPQWEPSLGRLSWPNGAIASVYSAANPEGLRGPEHDHAWCDEIAKWARAEASWDNLMFGLRRGERPRVLATTTPRPTPLMRRLIERQDVVRSHGRTRHNMLLASAVTGELDELYGGTKLGRQELDGELIEDAEGSLWPRALIERCRSAVPAVLKRVVIGVDPPASAAGDACGIVVCGVDEQGIGHVLADHSVRGLSPEGWARKVAAAAEAWGAERVVVETNQGGEMVTSLLAGVDSAMPVRAVRARFGKAQRAEPVAARFEAGKAKIAGAFPELEDELAGLTAGGGYEGPGRSPDRADAMVWAMSELLLAKKRAEPRVRFL
jgi:phage terminase large subunit-like protein